MLFIVWCVVNCMTKQNQIIFIRHTYYTYFVPKLLHFLWLGINLFPDVTACSLNDPLDAFAGDKFNEANTAASTETDSFELQLEELGADDGGSNFNDNLQHKIE